jgi:hypothetical protein
LVDFVYYEDIPLFLIEEYPYFNILLGALIIGDTDILKLKEIDYLFVSIFELLQF